MNVNFNPLCVVRNVMCMALLCFLGSLMAVAGRGQWTEEQAWEWQSRMGVIKGFNEPYPAYPGMKMTEILEKAHEVGLNSVRFWVHGSTAEEQIGHISRMIDEASKFGMTVSPVLNYVSGNYWQNRGNQPMERYEAITREVVRAFAGEERIAFWDLWNEPRYEDKPETYEQLDIIEQMVLWCRDENVTQPITSSIIWATIKEGSKPLKRMTEVEAMMDIHNFHYYNCALDFGKHIDDMLGYLKRIGDRPMVATECLTRTNGSGVARSLAAFSRYKANFYIWGLFVNDRNWETRWGMSTYDPYDPMFHNILYSDGDAYDGSEIELIRNYRFAMNGEELYPGPEVTDRWSHERAWRWMATGPLKGFDIGSAETVGNKTDGYNAVRMKLECSDWLADSTAFYDDVERLFDAASAKGLAVVPVLLSDDDFGIGHQSLAEYVGAVVGKYYCDTRVKAWELYHHPGEKVADGEALQELVTLIFRHARNQYANQPLMMTPYVEVKDFEEGFDYKGAMIHGRTAGWDRLVYGGGSSAELCYKIWSLSDVVAFSTRQPAPEAGWLVSICYRFGRPIFCTGFDTSVGGLDAMLERFATSHVFWFSSDKVSKDRLGKFSFKQTSTQRQHVEGIF